MVFKGQFNVKGNAKNLRGGQCSVLFFKTILVYFYFISLFSTLLRCMVCVTFVMGVFKLLIDFANHGKKIPVHL